MATLFDAASSHIVSDGHDAGGIVVRATSGLLLAMTILAGQVPSRFSLEDAASRVRQVQGAPDLVERLHSLGIEVWSYGRASVTFDATTARVVGWNDPARTLRVALRWTRRTNDSLVTLGSHRDDVARLHGTPWALTRGGPGSTVYLAYGRSVVRIDGADATVTGWIRRDASLRTDVAEDSAAAAAMRARISATSREPAPAGRVPAQRIEETRLAPAGLALSVTRVRVDDSSGDGALAPREFADITITVRNVGTLPTPPLRGLIAPDHGLHAVAGIADTFALGPLPPGGQAEVTVALYATAAANERFFSVMLTAGNGSARFRIAVPGAPASLVLPPGRSTTFDSLPRPVARNPDAIAVVIGIDQYRRLPSARYAANDARLFARFLTQALGVPDDGTHLITRTDQDATGGELQRLFGETGWIARRANANSDVFVFFAGHGAPDLTSFEPFLLPHDADAGYVRETGIALGSILDRLARLPARSITVVLDACFTGQTRDQRPLRPGTRATVVSIEHPALVRRNMAVFLASRGAQTAGDVPALEHGLFTWTFLRGLRGEADRDGDRIITVSELGQYVQRVVPVEAAAADREQEPVTIARDSLRVLARYARP